MNGQSSHETLERILGALEQELIGASDQEIRDAAAELGFNLQMKGSAAFLGLRYPARPRLTDYFGPDTPAISRIDPQAGTSSEEAKRTPGASRRSDDD